MTRLRVDAQTIIYTASVGNILVGEGSRKATELRRLAAWVSLTAVYLTWTPLVTNLVGEGSRKATEDNSEHELHYDLNGASGDELCLFIVLIRVPV